jgi:hypothetical protein
MLVSQVAIQVPVPPPMPADPNYIITQLIPLIGGVAALVVVALVARWLFHSSIGDAIAEGIRLRRRRRYGPGGEAGAEDARVGALEEQMRQLSAQVSELGERLDFAERLLTEQRAPHLGAGR